MHEWPALPLDGWLDTKNTLHRWMQIVGKIRMTLTPLINHWWNVTLYVSARGLTTSEIPCGGNRWFDMEFVFLAHVLRVRTSEGNEHELQLRHRSVANFYDELFSVLKLLRIECSIWPVPSEIVDNPIPLDRDEEHKTYDRDAAERFWRILAHSHDVLTKFRGEFIGKCSPVHFFWGGFDLAVTRFSGRRAPARPDLIDREAYSHEVSSVGWWPGDGPRLAQPSYYSYIAPEPEGFREAAVRPEATYYNQALGGFYLHYDDVRLAADPAQTLLDFCHSTYAAAADAGQWDREALERGGI
jgi:hypothetical protein